MSDHAIPITFGPGSQPAPEGEPVLDYIDMPAGMETYRMPQLAGEGELARSRAARGVLHSLLDKLSNGATGGIGLEGLDAHEVELVDQVLGEGEVSIRIDGETRCRIQESVLAGVWRVRAYRDEALTADWIEVGDIPDIVREAAFERAQEQLHLPREFPEGVINAPPVLVEIDEMRERCGEGMPPHVINLTLLPQTDADLDFLDATLGRGPVIILSRGYGNCRISATGLRNVWWVQYFNSQDVSILNTLEVSTIPAVACAAPEDIADSADRLRDILEAYA